jgi:hypothetical protein
MSFCVCRSLTDATEFIDVFVTQREHASHLTHMSNYKEVWHMQHIFPP